MVEASFEGRDRRGFARAMGGRGSVFETPAAANAPVRTMSPTLLRWTRSNRPWAAVGVGLCCLALVGCNVVPSTRLEDCHRLSQTLQTENARLKDTTVSLRSQNQDLNQRALDEARRLRLQEEEIQRLSQSVSAYQEERDQLAAAFERLKGQVRTSATASAGRPGRTDP